MIGLVFIVALIVVSAKAQTDNDEPENERNLGYIESVTPIKGYINNIDIIKYTYNLRLIRALKDTNKSIQVISYGYDKEDRWLFKNVTDLTPDMLSSAKWDGKKPFPIVVNISKDMSGTFQGNYKPFVGDIIVVLNIDGKDIEDFYGPSINLNFNVLSIDDQNDFRIDVAAIDDCDFCLDYQYGSEDIKPISCKTYPNNCTRKTKSGRSGTLIWKESELPQLENPDDIIWGVKAKKSSK